MIYLMELKRKLMMQENYEIHLKYKEDKELLINIIINVN